MLIANVPSLEKEGQGGWVRSATQRRLSALRKRGTAAWATGGRSQVCFKPVPPSASPLIPLQRRGKQTVPLEERLMLNLIQQGMRGMRNDLFNLIRRLLCPFLLLPSKGEVLYLSSMLIANVPYLEKEGQGGWMCSAMHRRLSATRKKGTVAWATGGTREAGLFQTSAPPPHPP